MNEPLRVLSLTVPLLISGISLITILKLNLIKWLNIPIDLGKSLEGKRVFGDSKTYRGIIVLMLMGTAVSTLLHIGSKIGFSSYIHPIFSGSPISTGLIYTIPYILGELVNSFFKRRIDIPPGGVSTTSFKSLQPLFDLSDGIIFTAIALVIFTSVTVFEAIMAGVVGIGLHYLTDIFMRGLNLKQKL